MDNESIGILFAERQLGCGTSTCFEVIGHKQYVGDEWLKDAVRRLPALILIFAVVPAAERAAKLSGAFFGIVAA